MNIVLIVWFFQCHTLKTSCCKQKSSSSVALTFYVNPFTVLDLVQENVFMALTLCK